MMDTQVIGRPVSRADGRLKVTGSARYTAETALPGLAHAVCVQTGIANGRVTHIETADAQSAPGVLSVLTRFTMPRLREADVTLSQNGMGGSAGQQYLPLQDDAVHYSGQHVAVVIAETLEQAAHAASLVRVSYDEQPPQVGFEAALPHAFTPDNGWPDPAESTRGDIAQGLAGADIRVDSTYHTAMQHHVTMEPHATVAAWEGDALTLYEPSTWVYGVRKTVATWLDMSEEKIRVVQDFVGGSFGAKGPVWPHVALAAVAARHVGRPVKLVLTRPQTFTSNGYRPTVRHRLRLGAKRDGTLTAVAHDATAQTAVFDTRIVAPVTKTTPKVYACPNVATTYQMVHGNLSGPFTFRGPGETPGLFALECAMDELAWALNMDPIALRLKNHADTDPESGKPWTSKHLRECYTQGAARFGWDRRAPTPRATRDGDWWVGMGMAGMMYDAKSAPATASAQISDTGQVVVQSATCDQGTGSYTIMPQIAADALGVPIENIRMELGDTRLPQAPISAGSQTAASVGSAVQAAARSLRHKLLVMATADSESPLHGLAEDDITVADGRAAAKSDPTRTQSYTDILRQHHLGHLAATEQVKPGEQAENFSPYSFGAHFAEVRVHADTGETRVARYTGAFAAGRILNTKTAHSQLVGGVVWGIGQALMEATYLHTGLGRIANPDLAEYHIPVSADIPDMDLFFVEEEDARVNPLGVKGIGEIGTIGSAAAIANAVYHATGKRVRDLPITPDKVI